MLSGTSQSIRLCACAAAGLLLVSCSQDPEESINQPDVLFVVIDTLRADRLGCYGYERGLTPVMDQIAREGAVFTRASSQAPWTVPSMASMLASQYPTAHFEHPAQDRKTLAEAFQDAGYRTLGVVANSLLDPGTGFERGFDVYIPREGPDGRRKVPGHFEALSSWIDADLKVAAELGPDGTRPPLFLYFHPSDPHAPYHNRKEYLKAQPLASVPEILPKGWQSDQLQKLGPEAPAEDPGWSEALLEIQRQRNAYDHDVRFTDQAFGKLLARLEELGVGDNLLIVIASDHGEELWEHVTAASPERLKHLPPREFFFQSHGYHLAEQALRTPIIFCGAGLPGNQVIDAPVENVDIFPTLVGLCGLEHPGTLDGLDLRPLLKGEVAVEKWREESYAYVIHSVSLRDEVNNLKVILPTEYGLDRNLAEPQLFDLTADPLERVNLIDSRPEDARRLAERLFAYLERYDTGGSTLDGSKADEMRRKMQEMGYAGMLVGED